MIKNTLNKFLDKDHIFFKIGLFFLPSAFSISVLFIIISLISQTIKRRSKFLKDKLNITLIIISSLMLLSCLVQNLSDSYYTDISIPNYLTWIGLFNWIPFFWFFGDHKDFLRQIMIEI